jgi:hypothetical protein
MRVARVEARDGGALRETGELTRSVHLQRDIGARAPPPLGPEPEVVVDAVALHAVVRHAVEGAGRLVELALVPARHVATLAALDERDGVAVGDVDGRAQVVAIARHHVADVAALEGAPGLGRDGLRGVEVRHCNAAERGHASRPRRAWTRARVRPRCCRPRPGSGARRPSPHARAHGALPTGAPRDRRGGEGRIAAREPCEGRVRGGIGGAVESGGTVARDGAEGGRHHRAHLLARRKRERAGGRWGAKKIDARKQLVF